MNDSQDQVSKTTIDFSLPVGYRDGRGNLHRAGSLRLATQMDRIRVMAQAGEVVEEEYLMSLMITRLITRLGDMDVKHAPMHDIVCALTVVDFDHLVDRYAELYRRATEPTQGHADAASAPDAGVPPSQSGESDSLGGPA